MYRRLVLFAFLIFVISFISGLIIGINNTHLQILYDRKVGNIFIPYILSYKYIIINNLKVIIFLIVGAFTLGISTFLNLSLNGYILGIIVSIYFPILGIKRLTLLILPHGIFEIPAIIIAGAAGFKIPYEIIRYLAGKKEQPLTKEDIKEYLTLALISIILIVIAAFVEAYITPRIAEYFLSKSI